MLVPIKIIRSSDFRQFHSQTASEDGTEGTCLNTELVPYSDIHCILFFQLAECLDSSLQDSS